MALLSIDEEMDRATLATPFSNGFEGEAWMNLWCDDCANQYDCPLIMVAVMNRVPAAWELRDPAGLNKYSCAEFADKAPSTQEINP
jgi:hypothetical protein